LFVGIEYQTFQPVYALTALLSLRAFCHFYTAKMLRIKKSYWWLKPPASLLSQACPELVEGSKDTELPAYRAFFVIILIDSAN
jgi:hypothetical protein